MRKLSFSPKAAKQVDLIYRYIARDNPAAAQRVIDRIYEVAEHVRANPGGGRATTVRGLRMFVVNPNPYLVFFRDLPNANEVRIVRVFHAAQRRPGLQDSARKFLGHSPLRQQILSDDERKGVERGLLDARRGNFASDEDVAALFAKYETKSG